MNDDQPTTTPTSNPEPTTQPTTPTLPDPPTTQVPFDSDVKTRQPQPPIPKDTTKRE